MKLSNGELRPGVVLEVLSVDGIIKASVPGLFSSRDQELLPPIYPFGVGASNTFSTPNIGDEVWVLSFTDNLQQLYWFRKDNFSENNGKRSGKSPTGKEGGFQHETNVEVLANRDSGTGTATLYFSDGTGWIIQNQDVIIQLDPNGVITLTNGLPHSTIEINDGTISLGTKGGSAHPACHGDKVANLFEKIVKTFSMLSVVAKANPYTTALGQAIDQCLETFKDDPNFINSEVVTLD